MGMREKLIEILRGVIKFHEEQKEKWILGGKVGERPSITESFVDILIANGVTIPVRCKECKHYRHPFCLINDNKHGWLTHVLPDHFCSYGERKTDD